MARSGIRNAPWGCLNLLLAGANLLALRALLDRGDGRKTLSSLRGKQYVFEGVSHAERRLLTLIYHPVHDREIVFDMAPVHWGGRGVQAAIRALLSVSRC
jgi:hypothetical protein